MRQQKSKKAMDMSWTMIGWMILAVIALIVVIMIIKNGTAPAFVGIDALGSN